MSKYRLKPDNEEGAYYVQKKGWFIWHYISWAKSLEEAEKLLQQAVRDELWPQAVPTVYYDRLGRRLKNSS